MTATAKRRLGPSGAVGAHAGELMVGQWLGTMAELRAPSIWPRAFQRLMVGSFDVADLLSPIGPGRARRLELSNKAGIARWTCRAGQYLGSYSRSWKSGNFELQPAVQIALERAPKEKLLWILEGLAYDYFRRLLIRGERPSPTIELIPREVQPILHTGLGLAVAEQLVEPGPRDLTPSRAEQLLDRGLASIRELTLPAATETREEDREGLGVGRLMARGIAFESVGLWICCRRRSWLKPMAASSKGQEVDGLAVDRLLWHGAGRGLYMAPIRKLPGYGSLDDALSVVQGLDLGDETKMDLVSGIGFAFFAINMGLPRVVETLLYRRRGEVDRSALGRGLAAAVDMRRLMPGGEHTVASFLGYRARYPAFWRAWILGPVAGASCPRQESLHRLAGIGQ